MQDASGAADVLNASNRVATTIKHQRPFAGIGVRSVNVPGVVRSRSR